MEVAVVSWFLRVIKDRGFGVTGLDKLTHKGVCQAGVAAELSKVGVTAAVLVVVFAEDFI